MAALATAPSDGDASSTAAVQLCVSTVDFHGNEVRTPPHAAGAGARAAPRTG